MLDCCAGAGGLGLEAASRAAASVTLVELQRRAATHLQQQYQRLKASNVAVYCADIIDYLKGVNEPYDVIFIDPPYARTELREQILTLLIERDLLTDGCKIYLEWPRQQQMQLNHQNLTWIKQKSAGQVEYAIAQWNVSR